VYSFAGEGTLHVARQDHRAFPVRRGFTMGVKECAWCGEEITGEGIKYNKLLFCSEECCDDYQDDLAAKDDDLDDLDDELSEEDLKELDFEDSDFPDDDSDDRSAYEGDDL
jgi:hypothetical protein